MMVFRLTRNIQASVLERITAELSRTWALDGHPCFRVTVTMNCREALFLHLYAMNLLSKVTIH